MPFPSRRLFPFLTVLAAALLAVSLAACAARLDAKGEVRLWTAQTHENLTTTASLMGGLELSFSDPATTWPSLLGGTEGADLLFVEWGGDFFEAANFASLADLGPRSGSLGSLRGLLPPARAASRIFPAGLDAKEAAKSLRFLPASGFPWGLYFDPAAVSAAGLASPSSWKDLEGSLAAIKASGRIPIALGAASGWPALAWFSYLDLRLNGAEAQARLIEGSRGFDDPSLAKVYETLARWRDSGWFGENPGASTWIDSVGDLIAGRAVLALLGAGLHDRFAGTQVDFTAVPPLAGGRGARGEIASLWGFALSAKARNPEAALAFADLHLRKLGEYQEGGKSDPDGRYRRSLQKAAATKAGAPSSEGLAAFLAREDGILAGASLLVPPLDKALAHQAAYDLSRAVSLFFTPGSGLGADELRKAFAAARPTAIGKGTN